MLTVHVECAIIKYQETDTLFFVQEVNNYESDYCHSAANTRF